MTGHIPEALQQLGEHVRHRQKQELQVVRLDEVDLKRRFADAQHVAVAQNNPFGLPRRTRRIDEGQSTRFVEGRRPSLDGGGVLFELASTELNKLGPAHGPIGSVGIPGQNDDLADARQPFLFGEELVQLFPVLCKDQDRSTVFDDVPNLVSEVGVIDGHGLAPGRENAQVCEHPGHGCIGQNDRAFPRCEAKFQESRGDFPALLVEFRPGHGDPCVGFVSISRGWRVFACLDGLLEGRDNAPTHPIVLLAAPVEYPRPLAAGTLGADPNAVNVVRTLESGGER